MTYSHIKIAEALDQEEGATLSFLNPFVEYLERELGNMNFVYLKKREDLGKIYYTITMNPPIEKIEILFRGIHVNYLHLCEDKITKEHFFLDVMVYICNFINNPDYEIKEKIEEIKNLKTLLKQEMPPIFDKEFKKRYFEYFR